MAYSLTYSYDSTSQSYLVTGWSNITTTDNVVIPSTYDDGTNGEHPVVGIDERVFSGCKRLTNITIPDSVTSIGVYAFSGCDSLKGVTIGNSVTSIGEGVFNWCSSLISITIGSGVTTIGNGAFSNCRSLTSVTIPTGVTSIGAAAFYNCSKLMIIYYGGTTEEWDKITIGSDNSYLTSAARYYYSETEPTKGSYFWHYVDGEIVFWGCSAGLAYSLKADNSGYIVSGIGTCTDTEIVIPPVYNGLPVVSLAGSAFKNNTNITSVIIPDSVTGAGVGQDVFSGCTSLTSATIGNGVTFMGWGMFNGCRNLTNVTIGSNVTTIGNGAFNSCKSLTNITIPDSVTTIGSAAFYNCTSLKSIVIPDSVKQFGSSVFQECTSLKTIVLFPETPPTLGSTNAIPTTISTIYVPQSAKEVYKTATNWKAFADKIVSDNLYLSFIRFNQKNKDYIDGRIFETNEAIKAENAKLKAQLDYLAMMTNIELDGEDEGNEEV